ncbi:hypothetical protein AB0G06_34440 [Nonomuraea dietziae]|uniref:hypothetical protein n=1 Tax=Nonomuraea dietziae TaxID=65515 RepID=UPI0033FE81DC
MLHGAGGDLTRTVNGMPTGREYAEAIQNPHLCFADQNLQASALELTKVGLPKIISGNNAVVFSLTQPSGRRSAIKCFTRHFEDLPARYRQIDRYLSQIPRERLSQPWKMGFEYLQREILVNGVRHPVLIMEWAEGQDLLTWLNGNHTNTNALDIVGQRLTELAADLRSEGIAHGDLQHGNIIVAPDLTLRLVDYDGLFVPPLAGQAPLEMGHRNYQSARRDDAYFASDVDHFSLWLICASLACVSIDPTLWNRLHEPDGEYLLLSGEDLCDLENSPRFPALLLHPDSRIRSIASKLRTMTDAALEEVPPLDPLAYTRMLVDCVDQKIDRADEGTEHTHAKPQWLTDYLVQNERASFPVAPKFIGRGRDELLAALCTLLLLVSLLVIPIAGLALLVIDVLALAPLGLYIRRLHHRRAELVQLHLEMSSLVKILAATRSSAEEQELFAEERKHLTLFEETYRERVSSTHHEMSVQLNYELARIESEYDRKKRIIDQDAASMDAKQNQGLLTALRPVQDPWVLRHLSRQRIRGAYIPHLNSVNVSDLARKRIKSAADFRGIIISGRSDPRAFIITQNGDQVRIKGIGPQKARALEEWRARCDSKVRSLCPITLPIEVHREIVGRFDDQRLMLAQQRSLLEEELKAARQKARDDTAIKRSLFSTEVQAVLSESQNKLEELARKESRIRGALENHLHVRQQFALLVQREQDLGLLRYFFFMLSGK